MAGKSKSKSAKKVNHKVQVSNDGTIDFTSTESTPTTVKKLRQSPEIESFYRFIYENDLRYESCQILDEIIEARKAEPKKKKTTKSK